MLDSDKYFVEAKWQDPMIGEKVQEESHKKSKKSPEKRRSRQAIMDLRRFRVAVENNSR
jgi:hypothetical protein